MRVQIVSFRCVLKNQLGHLISSSFNHDVVTTPSEGEPVHELQGFVEGLKGLKEGERKQIRVNADQAYGFYDLSLLVRVSRSSVHQGKKIRMGDKVRGRYTQDHELRTFTVVDLSEGDLLLDANHPLAGQDLVFDVEVTSSREENEEAEVQNKPLFH